MVCNRLASSLGDQCDNGSDYWDTYGYFQRSGGNHGYGFGFFAGEHLEDSEFDHRASWFGYHNHFAS